MTIPEPGPFVTEDSRASRARRRRARRALITGEGERVALIANLAQRAFPSLEFFIFALLCGAVLGAGYLFNSQGLLLFAVLLAPLLTPWIGLTLATTCGAWRFFLQTLAGLFFGAVLVFITGLLAGLAANLFQPSYSQLILHSRLWWVDIIMLILGAVLLVISFVRSEEKPILPSVMLAYELFPPLSAAAFALGFGLQDAWPEGLWVFLFHFCLATFLGIVLLLILRFRPLARSGYLLLVVVGLLSLFGIVALSGLGDLILNRPAVVSTPSPLQTSSVTPTTSTATSLLLTPQATGTATSVVVGNPPTLGTSPAFLPTETPTLAYIPMFAQVDAAPDFEGARMREAPGYETVIITDLPNGTLVELLPETASVDNVIWAHVYSPSLDRDGWMLQSVLFITTPTPDG